MKDLFKIAETADGLSNDEIAKTLEGALAAWEAEKGPVRNALVIPPDFTRFHSNAGFITQVFYRLLTAKGANVDVLPALGTHVPVSAEQWPVMFGDIPYSKMIVHNWRTDVVKLGEVPADEIKRISGGLWTDPVDVEVNRLLMDEKYDLIVSPGQVVPHEVIGMANHAKNIFVGVGGSDMINKSHMIGAVCGLEQAMGRDHTPVRQIFDYAFEHFVAHRPILWVLTVNTAPGGKIHSHGLFVGQGRNCLTAAVKLAQEKNVDYVEHGLKKCVVYLDGSEFKTTWLGNKAIYARAWRWPTAASSSSSPRPSTASARTRRSTGSSASTATRAASTRSRSSAGRTRTTCARIWARRPTSSTARPTDASRSPTA